MLEVLEDEVLRRAMKNIVAMLLQDPSKILFAEAKISTNELVPKLKEKVVVETTGPEPPFSKDYHNLNLIPKDWLRTVVLPSWEPTIFDADILKECEKACNGSIRGLFFMGAAVKETTKWIHQGKDRGVLKAALGELYVRRGSRCKHVKIKKDEKERPYIDWVVSGIYQFEPDPENANRMGAVKHIDGMKAQVPKELNIPTGFKILKSWHEHTAIVEAGKVTQQISKLFAEEEVNRFHSTRAEDFKKIVIECHSKAFGDDDEEEGGGESSDCDGGDGDTAKKNKSGDKKPSRRLSKKRPEAGSGSASTMPPPPPANAAKRPKSLTAS